MDCAFCEEKTDSIQYVENGFGMRSKICPNCMYSLEKRNEGCKTTLVGVIWFLCLLLFLGFVFVGDYMALTCSLFLAFIAWDFGRMDANSFIKMISTMD